MPEPLRHDGMDPSLHLVYITDISDFFLSILNELMNENDQKLTKQPIYMLSSKAGIQIISFIVTRWINNQ